MAWAAGAFATLALANAKVPWPWLLGAGLLPSVTICYHPPLILGDTVDPPLRIRVWLGRASVIRADVSADVNGWPGFGAVAALALETEPLRATHWHT